MTVKDSRSVNVDQQVDGSYLVQTYSDTKNGFTVMDGPPVRVLADASAAVLGRAVLDGLNRVRRGLPKYDAKRDRPDALFLAFVGAKSYKEYCKGVRQVSVQIDPDYTQLILSPRKPAGPNGGFIGVKERWVQVPYTDPTGLGQLVLDAFTHATAS